MCISRLSYLDNAIEISPAVPDSLINTQSHLSISHLILWSHFPATNVPAFTCLLITCLHKPHCNVLLYIYIHNLIFTSFPINPHKLTAMFFYIYTHNLIFTSFSPHFLPNYLLTFLSTHQPGQASLPHPSMYSTRQVHSLVLTAATFSISRSASLSSFHWV